MSSPNRLLCPLCHSNDRIEKVTAICNSGTSTGHYTGHGYGVGSIGGHLAVTSNTMNIYGQQRTVLSQKLSPPLPPWQLYRKRTPGTVWIALSCGLGLYATFYLLLIFTSQAESGASRSSSSVPAIPVPLIAGILFTLFLAMIIYGIIANRRAANKHRQVIANETPRWQQAMRTWDGLYYCYRDDVVFHPASPQNHAPTHLMSTLIW